jgi:hypothetical protein
MTEGLNKSFMDDPDAFMRNTPISIEEMLGNAAHSLYQPANADDAAQAGVYDFDLHKNANNRAYLRKIDDRTAVRSRRTNPIRAYWLPWRPRSTVTVSFANLNQLGVSFLFTSSLTGCRILMTDTHFAHIAGDGQAPNPRAWRDAQSNAVQGNRRRAFSTSGENGYGDDAFIVGYRAKSGFFRQRNGAWNFVAHRYVANDEDRYVVDRLWQNGDFMELQ